MKSTDEERDAETPAVRTCRLLLDMAHVLEALVSRVDVDELTRHRAQKSVDDARAWSREMGVHR